MAHSYPPDLIERVGAAMREASAREIEPRWNQLIEGDIRSKSPGELVTTADEAAERLLTARLRDLTPGIPVVGEEACAVDPGLLGALAQESAWLVDPVDGTANFIAGGTDWSVMVALLRGGQTCLAWIWRPKAGRMYVAERGSGAACNGRSIRRSASVTGDDSQLRGAVFTRFFDGERAAAIEANRARFTSVVEGSCAGFDYPGLVEGDRDFLLFWRSLPWDHAPGTLLVEEAGGYSRRLDGMEYRPAEESFGLLVAADEAIWHRATALLSPAPA